MLLAVKILSFKRKMIQKLKKIGTKRKKKKYIFFRHFDQGKSRFKYYIGL